jgi:hypothetical protein
MRNTAPSAKRRRRRTVIAAPAAPAPENPPIWQSPFAKPRQCANRDCPHGEAPGCPKWFTPKGAEKACSPKCMAKLKKASQNKAKRKYKKTNRKEINDRAQAAYAQDPQPQKRATKKWRASDRGKVNTQKVNEQRRKRRDELRPMKKCGNPDCPYGEAPGCPKEFKKRGIKEYCSRACFLAVWSPANRPKINKQSNARRRGNPAHRAKENARRDANRAEHNKRAVGYYHVKHPDARYYAKSGVVI